MKNPVATLSFAVAAAFLASPTVAQDSVALTDCVGDAITPWDDASATNGSEQCNDFIVDLAPLTTSCGTEFGIAPILKPSQSSSGFFSSGMSAQSISRVQLEDLPEEIRQAFPKPVVNGGTVQLLSEVEKDYILAVLELNDGNQTRTAKQLGIGAATLYQKLKKYGYVAPPPNGKSNSR